MKYTYPLIAVNYDTSTILLYNREEVFKFIKSYGLWHDRHKYNHRWYDWNAGFYRYETRIHEWILRDDRGREVKAEDFKPDVSYRFWHNRYEAAIKAAEKGLPIPWTGKRKWHRHSAPKKKNSGAGHRNRNRAKAIYDAKEYGIKNDVGNRVIPWEGY